MKWFRPIECDNTAENPFVCDYDNFEEYGYDQFSFKKGVRIEDWSNAVFMQAKEPNDDGNPDDALQNHLMIPIYAKRLIKELENANIIGIQYLPIRILRPNNDCLDGFSIANVLNFIEAFDYEKSLYNRFSEDFPNPIKRGQLAGVRKFVLKKDRIEGFDIIRLKDYKLSFFVSEKFVDIFEKNKFTGYSFIEVELV